MVTIEQLLNFRFTKQMVLDTVLYMLIEDARIKRATHILIEPKRDYDNALIYYYIKGKLEAQCRYSHEWYVPFRGRVFLMGDLDIAEREKLQNGAGVIEYNKRKYTLLISAMPCEKADVLPGRESLVIAFSDTTEVKHPGLDLKLLDQIRGLQMHIE
ncbi:MAG: hypothetical protein GY869_07880 [Planctomycetes bacterium]|nr:hypothetical protein [Planctomycetota bacterium]